MIDSLFYKDEMMTDHWSQLIEKPDLWTAPLRPSPEDIAHFKRHLLPGSRTLLLGVTSELLPFASVAVDNNPKAVQANPQIAILSDWADLPFEDEFDAVIGDGCLNIFQGSPELFFKQVKKVLKKSGRLILRIFVAPEEREALNDILKEKEHMAFFAFQLRVTNAMATPYLSVQDRCRIMRSLWDHPNLQIYDGSSLIYYHPKLSELPPWHAIEYSSSYELAEQCPIVMWQF